MISGCLMLGDPRSREITPFYKKQLPKLLIPLVVWNGIYFAVAVLTGSQPLSLSVFLQLLLGQGVKYHMWYHLHAPWHLPDLPLPAAAD